MNLDRLMEEIKQDEGVVYGIYIDSEGYKTFGIGHLITENDPEYDLPEGSPVSSERVHDAFLEDINWTLHDVERLFPNLYTYPETIQHVLANMTFNLGYGGLSKFINLRQAVSEEDWDWMAEEMEDSHWYDQVGSRSKRLVEEVLST